VTGGDVSSDYGQWRTEDLLAQVDELYGDLTGHPVLVEVFGRLVQFEIERDRARAVVGSAQTTVTFFASVIKSGEPWSPECEQALRSALDDEPISRGAAEANASLAVALAGVSGQLGQVLTERDRLRSVVETFLELWDRPTATRTQRAQAVNALRAALDVSGDMGGSDAGRER
jgi:hypothetical protein